MYSLESSTRIGLNSFDLKSLLSYRQDTLNFDNGLILITEQKKRYRNRQIKVEKPVMYSRQQPSLRNWMKIWRPQKTNDKSGDFLFIQKDGQPFPSEDALRNFLAPSCKSVWTLYCPKIMREWNAIARLIRTKERNGKHGTWDIREVTKALVHKHQSTTDIYVEFAELYYDNDNYDWLRAVLKFHPTSKRMQTLMKQEHMSSKENLTNAKKGLDLISFLREKLMLPSGFEPE